MTALAVALAVAAASFAGSGVALLLRRRAVVTAGLMTASGSAGVAAALGAPLALVSYPTLRWRHPVDFLALVVIGGCGAVATAYLDAGVAALMGLVQGCVFLAYVWWRIEIARDRERRALAWLALAVTVTGLAYFFLSFSAEGMQSSQLTYSGIAVFALVGPALYVGCLLYTSDAADE